MRKTVDFFFDVGSPASYLAWTQLPGMCESHGAELVYRPMLLGGVYQATGNASPATIPVKARYWQLDYERHARRYGVPLKENVHFPIITLFLMRAITGIQLRRPEQLQQLLGCVFKALWIDALNLNDPKLTADILKAGGFDPGEIERRLRARNNSVGVISDARLEDLEKLVAAYEAPSQLSPNLVKVSADNAVSETVKSVLLRLTEL